MPLNWKRERDGEYNGRPCYEYTAVSGDRTYHIVWAYDHGGTFGYTAKRKNAEGQTEYLSKNHNIVWARTLTRCKGDCEKIEREFEDGK